MRAMKRGGIHSEIRPAFFIRNELRWLVSSSAFAYVSVDTLKSFIEVETEIAVYLLLNNYFRLESILFILLLVPLKKLVE